MKTEEENEFEKVSEERRYNILQRLDEGSFLHGAISAEMIITRDDEFRLSNKIFREFKDLVKMLKEGVQGGSKKKRGGQKQGKGLCRNIVENIDRKNEKIVKRLANLEIKSE